MILKRSSFPICPNSIASRSIFRVGGPLKHGTRPRGNDNVRVCNNVVPVTGNIEPTEEGIPSFHPANLREFPVGLRNEFLVGGARPPATLDSSARAADAANPPRAAALLHRTEGRYVPFCPRSRVINLLSVC